MWPKRGRFPSPRSKEGLVDDEEAALMSDIEEKDDDKIENNAFSKVFKPVEKSLMTS